jgi:hypothetical protein
MYVQRRHRRAVSQAKIFTQAIDLKGFLYQTIYFGIPTHALWLLLRIWRRTHAASVAGALCISIPMKVAATPHWIQWQGNGVPWLPFDHRTLWFNRRQAGSHTQLIQFSPNGSQYIFPM